MAVSFWNRARLLNRLNLLFDAAVKRHLSVSSYLYDVVEAAGRNNEPPEYPPILDQSVKGKREREVQKWHKVIQDMPSVEEKQFELNMAKYYGHWTAHLYSHNVHYNHAEFAQFVTRTNVDTERWPEAYDSLNENVKKFLPLLRKKVEDILLMELVHRTNDVFNPRLREQHTSDNIIKSIHHALVGLLSADVEHIADSQFDVEPRMDAFWWTHGVPVDARQKAMRKGDWHTPEEDYELPVQRPIQYQGEPSLLVRGRLPLPALAAADAAVCRQGPPLPLQSREPRSRQVAYKFRHGTNVAGVWSQDRRPFGQVLWMTRHHLQRHAVLYGEHAAADRPDALQAQACLAGFASCLAQACHAGFTPLTELTYPLTAQTVITDGRLWSFSAYQLNSTAALLALPEEGALGNACWSQPEAALYQSVGENGVEGLSDAVLERLLQLYLLAPSDRGGIALRPYLDPANSVENLESDWLRARYREDFFRMTSNRPKHRLKDEIYLWENIYKVKFQTRPQEARKRFFELEKFPSKRRLDEELGRYIPKALRPANIPGYLRQASKREPNPHHEIAKLRGRRSEKPLSTQEMAELESWRSSAGREE